MKRLFHIIIIMNFIPGVTLATGQTAERIIYNGDTLPLLSLPLEDYLRTYAERISKFPFLKEPCSTDLWRNYQGLWKLEDNKLFLIDVYSCADSSIYQELMGTQFPVKAEWFTGELYIQHGKILKYDHVGFNRVYERETVITIDRGTAIKEKHYENGYREDDTNVVPDSVMVEIYKQIRWEELPRLSEDYKVYLQLKIGETDRITIVRSAAPESYVNQIRRIIDDFPET